MPRSYANEVEVLGVSYTKDDFLETSKPYEAVWKLRDDAFKQKQALAIMAAAAQEIGVRNFKSLFNDFAKAKKFESREIMQSATNFTGQKLELNAGEWYADDSGVRRGEGMFEEIACPHPIMPIERITNIDTGQEKFNIAWLKGRTWKTKIVPRSQIAQPRELVKLADDGISVNARSAPVLSDWFMDVETLNYDILPEKQSVSRLGWIDAETFSPFVDGILFDGDESYRDTYESVTQTHGDLNGWIEAAKLMRSQGVAARIVLASSFASAILKPLGVLPFFVHLWGTDSSTGKTVALMGAASVWGDPNIGKYVKTFRGTDNGFEYIAGFLNSMPMCIDELQLARGKKGKVQFNVYQLAQGAGKLRATRTGGVARTLTWANAIITTGESPIVSSSDGAGAINRVIEIECESKAKVIENGRDVSSAFKNNYGFAGHIFVEELMKPGVLDEVEKIYLEAFEKLNNSSTTDKQASPAALIVAADAVATRLFFNDGMNVTTKEIASFLADKESVSTGKRAYEFLCGWIAKNANRFVREGVSVENGDVFGAIEDGYAYINRSVFTDVCENEGFNTKSVLSFLKGEKLILTRDKNLTRGKRINGVNVSCICVKIDDTVGEVEMI